ncbi:unnamed protein product, partial [Ranitomeya imitator]
TNGQTERTNQTLETYLRCFVSADQDDWVSFLPLAEFALNNGASSATLVSNFFCNSGFHPRFSSGQVEPSDCPGVDAVVDRLQQIWTHVVDNLTLSQEKAQRFANRRRCVGPRLRVGDLVWLSSRHAPMKVSSPKFKPRFIGPYKISEVLNPVSFRLDLPASFAIHNVFHRSLLRRYVAPMVPSVDPPAPVLVEGELEYVVEKILDSRVSRRKLQYLVKWKGYGQEAGFHDFVLLAGSSGMQSGPSAPLCGLMAAACDKGSAEAAQSEAGDPALRDVDAFFLALGLLYDELNSVDQAEKILLALCQGQDEAEIYCQKFRKWSVLTQWNECALAAIFRKGLSEALKDVMVGFPMPAGLNDSMSLAIQINRRLRERKAVHHLAYPLPLLSDLFARIKGASWFTKIDLRGAYNLVRIKQGDEWKSAFNTPEGHFEYLVMPFGLSNVPSVFQSFMHDIFREYLDKFLIVYLDDILVFSDDWESHVTQVRMVFQVLRANSLFVKGSKCLFGVQKVSFFGFIFSPSTIEMDPVKVQAIYDWTQPTSVKSLQKFLGFANFYRRFIANFSTVAKPLTDLTKKGADVVNWSSAAVEAFQELKRRFSSAPVLCQPDVSLLFQVEVDASEIGAGAVLSQRSSDGLVMKPCAFFSRKFSPAERNHDVGNRELLAMKWAFKEWRHWLEGAKHRVVVLTDHKNLTYLESAKRLNPRQARWSLFFSRFDFVVSYLPGSKNVKADALSRSFVPDSPGVPEPAGILKEGVESSDCPGVDTVVDRLQQIWTHVVDNLTLSQEKAQRFANRWRCVGPRLRVGDLVWLLSRYVPMKVSSPKFKPRFIGPYKISEVINPVSFRLALPASFAIHNVFHRSLLRRYVAPVVPSVDPPATVLVEGELEYVVEKILDSHVSRRKLYSLLDLSGDLPSPAEAKFLILSCLVLKVYLVVEAKKVVLVVIVVVDFSKEAPVVGISKEVQEEVINKAVLEVTVVEDISKETVVGDISKVAPEVDISMAALVADVSKVVPVVDVSKVAPVADISKAAPVVDVSKVVPAVDISKAALVEDISKVAPEVDINKVVPVADVSKVAPVEDISKVAPVADVSKVALAADISKVVLVADISKAAQVETAVVHLASRT